jgi:hypothetical protein
MPLGPLRNAYARPPKVAICGVWDIAHLGAKSRSTANTAVRPDAIPVGDAGGHDGSDSGLSVANESPDLPSSSERGPGCQSSSVSHRVSCAPGNLDTSRNRGAAGRALANARAVSPSASYLKRHQVTKCPGSWFGPSFLGSPHSGDAPWARRHPPSMAGGGSRGIHAARPTPRHLRSACTQVAICGVWTVAYEDQDQDQDRRRRRRRRQRQRRTPNL